MYEILEYTLATVLSEILDPTAPQEPVIQVGYNDVSDEHADSFSFSFRVLVLHQQVVMNRLKPQLCWIRQHDPN